jgi:hypothetical protein
LRNDWSQCCHQQAVTLARRALFNSVGHKIDGSSSSNSSREIPNPNPQIPGKSQFAKFQKKQKRREDARTRRAGCTHSESPAAARQNIMVFRLHFARSALGVRGVLASLSSLNIARIWKNYIPNISAIRAIRGHSPLGFGPGIWDLLPHERQCPWPKII